MVKYRIKKLNTDNLILSNWEKIKLNNIQNSALRYKWNLTGWFPLSKKLTLEKNGIQLVINILRNDVVSTMDHPSRGLTKLKRSTLSLRQIELILENPFMHSDRGEYITMKGFNNPSIQD